MRSHFARSLGIAGTVLLFASMAAAQPTLRVRGQLQLDPRQSREPFEVELISDDGSRASECAEASANGDFEFRDVAPGDYQVVVTSHRGGVVHQEWVSIREDTFLTIRLRDNPSAHDSQAPVSVRQLQRKIPGAALKEMHKSEQAFAKADYSQAVSHLHKAIDRYPDYAEAHNDLGVCYFRMHESQSALREFQKACELDPDSAEANANLAAAFFQSARYADAERVARRALKLDPLREFAHLMLGFSLTQMNRGASEALQNLRRAAGRFPDARLAMAEILHRGGHPAEAAAELRLYLQSPMGDQNRQFVEAWLARLQNREKTQPPAGTP